MKEAIVKERREEILPVRTVAIIAMQDNHIVFVRHKAGTTAGEGVSGLPGGRQNLGESEEEAAVREFKEETGLVARTEDLIEFPGNYFKAMLNFNNGHLKEATMKVFISTKFEGKLLEDALEVTPGWVSLQPISRGLYHTLPNVLQAIHNASTFLNQND